jgi:anti-sigma factor RsiW
MSTSCRKMHQSLSAYVDGELTPTDANAVATHLSECARCSANYSDLLTTVAAIRGALGPYSAPDVLRARVRVAIAAETPEPATDSRAGRYSSRPSSRWLRGAAVAAAVVACAALGSGATLLVTRRSPVAPPLAEQVLASHVRSLMPDHLTDVRSSDQHNVKPWFNGRLDYSPSVPALDQAGFPLIGGRLDYVAGRPVAVVVYGRRQHVINVFSWPSAGDAPEAASAERGYHILHWRSGGAERWVVSDLNPAELESFAALLKRGDVAGDAASRTR